MEGLRSGGETGYGAQPSIEFKVQVRTADMEIPCPGHQGDIRQWRYTYVLYFPAVRLGFESEVFFRTPDQELLFYQIGFPAPIPRETDPRGNFSHSLLWSDCCTVFPREYLTMQF